MVLYFKVKKRSEAEAILTERITNRLMDHAKNGMEDILGDNSEVPMKVRNWYKVTLRHRKAKQAMCKRQNNENPNKHK